MVRVVALAFDLREVVSVPRGAEPLFMGLDARVDFAPV